MFSFADLPALHTGDFEEILQERMTVLGGDAFWMKLHAMDGMGFVLKPHDNAVIGFSGDRKAPRQAIPFDNQ